MQICFAYWRPLGGKNAKEQIDKRYMAAMFAVNGREVGFTNRNGRILEDRIVCLF